MPENLVHPSAVIGESVTLGVGNHIGPNVVIAGGAVIGDGNWFGANVVIGALPEVRGFPHDATWIDGDEGPGLRIGSGNVLREGAQVHRGWHESTRIGDDAFIMNQVYIAHDCVIGDSVTMASNVAIGGHCAVGDYANLGLGTVVNQRRQIGMLAMVGMGSVVTRDVPPFVKAFGNPAKVRGINSIGLQRRGVSDASVRLVIEAEAAGELENALASLEELQVLLGTSVGR